MRSGLTLVIFITLILLQAFVTSKRRLKIDCTQSNSHLILLTIKNIQIVPDQDLTNPFPSFESPIPDSEKEDICGEAIIVSLYFNHSAKSTNSFAIGDRVNVKIRPNKQEPGQNPDIHYYDLHYDDVTFSQIAPNKPAGVKPYMFFLIVEDPVESIEDVTKHFEQQMVAESVSLL